MIRELLAVYILVFFSVIAVGIFGLAIYSWPPLGLLCLAFGTPFAIVWAIGVLEETK